MTLHYASPLKNTTFFCNREPSEAVTVAEPIIISGLFGMESKMRKIRASAYIICSLFLNTITVSLENTTAFLSLA